MRISLIGSTCNPIEILMFAYDYNLKRGICTASSQSFLATLGAERRMCNLGNTADSQQMGRSCTAIFRSGKRRQQQARAKRRFTATEGSIMRPLS
jgi:hypothetical protein